MEQFKITKHYGKDDLISEYPYSGDDWGHYYTPYFTEVTEEQYKSDPKAYSDRVKSLNEAYIKKLKEKDEYLKPYILTFNFTSLPEFDDPPASNLNQWQIAIPMGNVKNEEPPKFNLKYDEKENLPGG